MLLICAGLTLGVIMPNSGVQVVHNNVNEIADIISNLKKLPPNELNYYLGLLIACIENDPKPSHRQLLEPVNHLITALNAFYTSSAPEAEKLDDLMSKLKVLIECSKVQTLAHKVKKALLNVASVILGFTFGLSAALFGFISGLFSDYTVVGNFRGAYLGFITGLCLGSYVGSRSLDKVFQSDFERKLEFCIVSLSKVSEELPHSKVAYQDYEKLIQAEIMAQLEGTDEEKAQKYQAFLESDQTFQVGTTTARFIANELKGHLGHHFLIRYKINIGEKTLKGSDLKGNDLLELGYSSKIPKYVDQNEQDKKNPLVQGRKVNGRKLVEMLALERVLKETHPYNSRFLRQDYDIGSNDCRTYVDKILLGTGQAPTVIPRFNSNIDKLTGRLIVAPTVRFFSKISETELNVIASHYKDENEPGFDARTWSKGVVVPY